MINPFEVEINSEENIVRKYPKKEEKLEPIMRPIYPQQVIVNSNKYKFLKFFAIASIIAILFLGYSFLDLTRNGAFKSVINQDVALQPNMTSTSNNFNNYSFPDILNNFTNNHTIVNQINCPNVTCNC